MAIELSELWTVTAILIGLQIGAMTWRAFRAINFLERGPIGGLLPADIMALIAMAVAVLGVFVVPLAGIENLKIPKVALGISIILSVGYPFALVVHYALHPGGPGAARQAMIAVVVPFLVALLLLLLSLF